MCSNFEPMLQTMAHTLAAAGIEDSGQKRAWPTPGTGVSANIRACYLAVRCLMLLIATTKDWKQRKMLRETGVSPRAYTKRTGTWMERKLLTKRGRALYKKRGVLVEPVFGQVKEGQGFRRFMRRGLGAAQSEWSLAGMTHNLLKLWRQWPSPLGLGPWPHGTKRGRRPTSGQWNWTGRSLLRPIAPITCVSQLAHRSMRQTLYAWPNCSTMLSAF